jgi:DNA topoisomerase-3
MYYSALARSRADWLVGMNLSRLFTVLGRQAGYDGVLSVGRVQTPTLKLVVDRDREIAAFVSVPYWAIDVSLSAGGQSFTAQLGGARWQHRRRRPLPGRSHSRPRSRSARGQCPGGVGRDRARARRPAAAVRPGHLAGGVFQAAWAGRAGNAGDRPGPVRDAQGHDVPALGFGYLPESMFAEVPTVLDSLLKTDPSLRPIMGQLDRTQRSRAWNDGKVTAHHGIIPTLEPANLSAMSEKELAVYRLIRAHYLAQFLPHHEFDRTVAKLSCGQQKLAATGKQVVARGWRQVLAEPQ